MKFEPGTQVKLTDHRVNDEFYRNKYKEFEPEWKRFWDEYVDRQLTIIGESEEDSGVLLAGLPDYIDHDISFFSDEIEGIIDTLPEELFRV